MSTPSGIIFDLDGTVYRGGQLIPGAGEAVAELRRRGHPIVFVTNALESPVDCAAKLIRLDVPTRPGGWSPCSRMPPRRSTWPCCG